MTASAILSVRIEDIRMDGGTQSRAGIDPAVVERYAEAVDELPPVDLFHDGESYWLADGFHRVAALEQRGRDLFNARVHQGTQRDAILYACGANAHHGLPRTTADARRAVERLLADEEWRARSDRWIATTCRVSPTWVGRLRAELGAHAEVREYERAGVTHHMDLAKRERGEGPLSTVDSRNVGEDTFQAPEPDNVVRTKVVHEHQGAPLTEEQREAIVKLMRSGWTRAHVAERFRVAPMDVDAVMAAAAPVDAEEPAPELVGGAPTEAASTLPLKRFAAPSKSDPDRRTDRDLELSQWWTPADLAEYLVNWAGITLGDHVLEPAAGTGAIVAALLAAGASVEAHEIDGHWIPQLKGRCSNNRLEVWHDDYLASPPPERVDGEEGWPYKWGVTNPPYENGLDGRFLSRLLSECENVVALVRVNIFLGSGRYAELWEKYGSRLAQVEFISSRPDFADGEEGFDGALSDFVLLRFDWDTRPASRGPFSWCTKRFGGGA